MDRLINNKESMHSSNNNYYYYLNVFFPELGYWFLALNLVQNIGLVIIAFI